MSETQESYEEHASSAGKSYEGIGGWLILPLIGLIATPFITAFMLHRDFVPIFTDGTWSLLTTPGAELYDPIWAPLLVFELIGNGLVFVFALVLLWLFIRKSRLLPGLFVKYMLFTLAFVVADAIVVGSLPGQSIAGDPETIKQLTQAFIGTAIWVPYFIRSKRVQQTFVN